MFIVFQNLITYFTYLCNFKNEYRLEYDNDKNKDDEDEIICYCNLCVTIKNISLFMTRRLKFIKYK